MVCLLRCFFFVFFMKYDGKKAISIISLLLFVLYIFLSVFCGFVFIDIHHHLIYIFILFREGRINILSINM